jgi:hypothetical protein
MKKVFLSSTWRDMKDRRAAILKAIRLLDGFDIEAMEEFGSRAQPPLDVCLEKLAECDVVFGVLGAAYGSSPPDGDPSYTEREYIEARRRGLPCLMVVVDDVDVADPRQTAFRERVERDHTTKHVRGESPDFLGVLAVTALANLVKAELTDRFEAHRRAAEGQDRKLRRLERAIAEILQRSRAAMQALLDNSPDPMAPALSDQALSEKLARALMGCQHFSEAIVWLGKAYRDCDDRGDRPARQALSKAGGHLLPWVYVADIDRTALENLRAETQTDIVRLPCGLNSFAEIVLAGLVPRPGRRRRSVDAGGQQSAHGLAHGLGAASTAGRSFWREVGERDGVQCVRRHSVEGKRRATMRTRDDVELRACRGDPGRAQPLRFDGSEPSSARWTLRRSRHGPSPRVRAEHARSSAATD